MFEKVVLLYTYYIMKGFTFEEITLNDACIYLCKYVDFNPADYVEFLTEIEIQKMFSFGHLARRREFVATRILRHRIFGFEHIHYDAFGAPYVEKEGYISISHGKNYVGIALNQNYKIGLDLETPRDNILEIMPKFISPEEMQQFDITDPMEVTKIWSAKEALYKLAGRKQIIFKTDLCLSKVDAANWKGRIVNPDHDLLVNLNIFEFDGTIVSINTQEIVKQDRNI